jgi:hypothetical protein
VPAGDEADLVGAGMETVECGEVTLAGDPEHMPHPLRNKAIDQTMAAKLLDRSIHAHILKATLNQFSRWRAPGRGMGCEAQTAAIAAAMARICNEADRPQPGCATREGLVQRCLKALRPAASSHLFSNRCATRSASR